MEDAREIFNLELLLLATLPLLFYVICQLFANGFLCHRKLVSLSHLKSRECKEVMEGVLLSTFQVKSRLSNPIHSLLQQCRFW